MDNLNGIVAFVRTAETLSFVAAGRKLGISASAVGKTIARLERSLGVRLFHRTTRRVTLTEEGRHFHERCHRILEELRDAEATLSASAQTPRGRLRVSLPVIGYRFLLPVLPAFSARYPDIELDLDFNDRLVDVVEGGFDAVIRSGQLSDSSLMSRRLGPFRFVLCASPDYLARAGVPRGLADLAAHEGVRYRFPTTGKLQPWSLLPDGGEPPNLRCAMTCNNMEALRGAVIAGFGIGFMPDFLARDALAAGSLVEVLEPHSIAPGQFSILWPSSRQLSPKLRVFVDFMCEHLFPAP
ncbi:MULTISPECIES: LysR family transcriptional regulator [Burkholderia]|jgi:DNA-binding transcriptional LysR family regulator|uniref:Bacterial regulatory helix-turn-helix, lysR family protein n=1 Tax=Burkholderia gladioli TaxID=28095 RepID=A0A095HNS2_BURGA|nr:MULTISPECIES: LysR family transcriptional regulator [Burkholderia]AJW96236.1 bacterial regulatory helix-turn-helix, lysR family protein [Burkholderia gladioli]ASD82233.1 LysR family transcriptional regulator [Burkholderia gladioli pv. gladioli]AWY52484.1 LysR family transcriptional regulator [Burkholderia gladioli pv. gladioli]KAF1060361.1 HTH-type transcriptional regulator DmlR [Burkholderia gladioli]KGC15199.1 bacterial regulatory helix-turn-helix, lysR family protein [Burkholderia gladio